jgi:hypothetical protein
MLQAWIYFTNVGSRCNLPTVHVSIGALSGNTMLAYSVVLTNLVSGNNVLLTGQSARAEIAIEPTNDPAFRKSCQPKSADRLEVLPLYDGWPKKYFPLSPKVLVCTGGSDNLGGGVLLKSPR